MKFTQKMVQSTVETGTTWERYKNSLVPKMRIERQTHQLTVSKNRTTTPNAISILTTQNVNVI